MRKILCYWLLLMLALSGFTGSVPNAMALTLADSLAQLHQQQNMLLPPVEQDSAVAKSLCDMQHSQAIDKVTLPAVAGSINSTDNAKNAASVESTEHDCCKQIKHSCDGECCTKHGVTASALLAAELLRYVRASYGVTPHTPSLQQWLFAEDPPPPINA